MNYYNDYYSNFCFYSEVKHTIYRDDSSERNYHNYEDQLTPGPRRQVYRNNGRRTRNRNRNRRRRKNRPSQTRRDGTKTCGPPEAEGVCRNFMSCMLSGRRLDFQADQGRHCDELFSVCCTKWPTSFAGPSLTRHKRKRNR